MPSWRKKLSQKLISRSVVISHMSPMSAFREVDGQFAILRPFQQYMYFSHMWMIRWASDNERLCAMVPILFTTEKISASGRV